MIFVFVFRGDQLSENIKVEAKLKLSVGDDNSADIEFNGEATGCEAAKTFANNDYLEALNGNIEICVDKECNNLTIPI